MWALIVIMSPIGVVLCVPTGGIPNDGKRAPDDKSQDEKIYGGRAAGDVPFMVSIQRDFHHFCGGSILTLEMIYTACHCVADISLPDEESNAVRRPSYYDPEDFTVVAGEKDLRQRSWRTQRRHVKHFFAHPKCQVVDDILEFDYGLITLSESFDRSPNVKEIKLRHGGKVEYDAYWEHYRQINKRCAVFGWGKTEAGYIASTLRVTVMKIISDEVCSFFLSKKHYAYNNYNFTENGKVCATGMLKNNSDCEGDSGGPIFCEGHVMGSVSYGFECGEGEQPAVYATMGELIQWYHTIAKKNHHHPRSTKNRSVLVKSSSLLLTPSLILGITMILGAAHSWVLPFHRNIIATYEDSIELVKRISS